MIAVELKASVIAILLIFSFVSAGTTRANHDTGISSINQPGVVVDSESILLNDRFIEEAREAIELLYNREYEASVEQLSHWKEQYPEHPIWLLWRALDAWWPVLVDLEDDSNDDTFLTEAEKVIDLCNRLLDENEEHLDARIVRSIMYGQLARFYSNRYSWYRSFRNARRSLRDFFRIEESHPDIPDLHFGIGMYRYFAAFLVDEYTLAKPLQWMLPRGDRQEGLNRLKQAADSSIFVGPEAVFFLGHIYLHYEQQPHQALQYLRKLYHDYPDNTYYRRLYVRSLFQLQRSREANAAITESLAHWEGENRHAVHVMREDLYTIRGQLHYHHRQFKQAETAFQNAIDEAENLAPFASRSNLITSLYYLGEINIHNERPEEARFYFNRAATPDIDHPYTEKAREALKQNDLE